MSIVSKQSPILATATAEILLEWFKYITAGTTEGVNRDVKSEYQDMTSERGLSSVDTGRLAVTALLQRLRATRSISAIQKPETSGYRLRNA